MCLCLMREGTALNHEIDDYDENENSANAMEAALQETRNATPWTPGFAGQPAAAAAEQPWEPGSCTDYPGARACPFLTFPQPREIWFMVSTG